MARFEIGKQDKKSFFTDTKTSAYNFFGDKTAVAKPTEYRKALNFIPISDTAEKIQSQFRNSISEISNVADDLEKSNDDFYAVSGIRLPGLLDYVAEVDDQFMEKTFLSETQQRVLSDADGRETFGGTITSDAHRDAKIAWIENEKELWHQSNRDKSFQPYSYYYDLTKKELAKLEQQLAIESQYADEGSLLPNMMGSLKGVHKDPLILAQYPLALSYGGNFKTWGNVAKMAFTEFAIATSFETAIQSKVVSYNQELGSDYNWTDAMKVIGLTGVGAAAGVGGIGATVKGTAAAYTKIFKSSKNAKIKDIAKELNKNIDAGNINDFEAFFRFIDESMSDFNAKDYSDLLELVPEKTSTANNVEQVLKAESIINDSNPFPDTPSAQLEHIDRANKANKKLLNDHNDVISDETIHEINPNTTPSKFEILDPDDIQVDAGTFQFKTDPSQDEFGVSKKLQGITKWNQDAANVILVWERADGVKFIADGHQRLGLAKRIKAQNDGQKIELRASVYREVDGYNREDLFVKAAVVNVMNNTAEAADLAKVVREFGSASTAYALEVAPRNSIWRTANDLAELDPMAWNFYLNNKIDDKVAAAVGRLVKDKDLHIQALEYLSKNKYPNQVQLESAISDLLNAGQTVSKTEDLFGEQVVKEFLINERAAVLDRGIKQLQRDKSISGYLVKNDEAIQKGGKNKLNNEYNKKIHDETAITLEKIIKLAKMKGELSDELTAAARLYKDGNKKEAIRYFKEAARRSIGSDDLRGISTSGSERLPVSEGYQQPKPKDPPKSETTKSLDEFEDPHDGSSALKIADDELEDLVENQSKRSGDLATAARSIPPSGEISQSPVLGSRATTTDEPSTVFANATAIPLKSRIEVTSSIGDVSSISGLRILQITDNINDLYKLAKKNIKGIKNELQSVAKNYEKTNVIANLKLKNTLLENIAIKQKTFKNASAANEPDIARGAILVENLSDIPNIIKDIEAKFKVTKEPNNYFLRPKRGYRAVHIQLLTKDGLGFELQIHHKDLFKLYKVQRKREDGYNAYKKLRKPTPEQEKRFEAAALRDKAETSDLFKKIQDEEDLQTIQKLDEDYEIEVTLDDGTMMNKTTREMFDDIQDDRKIIDTLAACPGIQ